ncbi:unnamed protein product [Adineta ricciae]|uniref:Uncharacterized protein n=1 Tax=Adineta ricciae TaxID=249248 RepID=A0A815FHI4_ADIRI|nr:unnamed protein product [Adineta ricciae]CAF1520202.1 unnamed protein product [Adineta ricciae]
MSAFLSCVPGNVNTVWKQNGITVAGCNEQNGSLGQANLLRGIDIDDDFTLYIADQGFHRVVKWKLNTTIGQVIAGGNGRGDGIDQLSNPTDVVIDRKKNTLIICDAANSRLIRVFLHHNSETHPTIILKDFCHNLAIDSNGTIYISNYWDGVIKRWNERESSTKIVAGGHGRGNNLDQLNSPTYFFVDQDYSIYVSDRDNHRVMKWIKDAQQGVVIVGGQDKGDKSTQLRSPKGLMIDNLNNIYVVDEENHRVMRFSQGSRQGIIIVGGNGVGNKSNQFHTPEDIIFDKQGNLYVTDYFNRRVQKFYIAN